MNRAVENYHKSSRHRLEAFLGACCDVVDGISDEATALYLTYRRWCEEAGHRPFSQTAFGWALSRAGFTAKKVGGQVYRRGLRRKSCPPPTGAAKVSHRHMDA